MLLLNREEMLVGPAVGKDDGFTAQSTDLRAANIHGQNAVRHVDAVAVLVADIAEQGAVRIRSGGDGAVPEFDGAVTGRHETRRGGKFHAIGLDGAQHESAVCSKRSDQRHLKFFINLNYLIKCFLT